MKPRARICLLTLPVILLIAFFCNGCHEKGCTNPHALNYNSVADVDDGSCIVCQSTQSETGSNAAFLVDFNFSSPHFNDSVAQLSIRQIRNNFNNSACGSDPCTIYFKIQSLISDTMDFFYVVQFNNQNGTFFSFNRLIRLNPFETTIEEAVPSVVSSPCGVINLGFLNFNSNSTIVYH